jgi:hypothetical protein
MPQLDLIPDDGAGALRSDIVKQNAEAPRHESTERDAEWLEVRKEGKISRRAFTDAVKVGLRQTFNPPPSKEAYPAATNRLYIVLCDHTAKQLRMKLGLPEGANIRDHLGIPALSAISLAESSSAEKMRDLGEELTFGKCLEVIDEIVGHVSTAIKAISASLGKNIFTGERLSGAPQLEG